MSLRIKDGSLNIENISEQETPGVDINLSISHENALQYIRGTFAFKKKLEIADCVNFEGFYQPSYINIGEDLDISDCPRFTALCGEMKIGNQIRISSCKAFSSFPNGLKFRELVLVNLSHFNRFPDTLKAENLYLEHLSMLENLPGDLQLSGRLIIVDCPNLKGLPQGMNVDGALEIYGNNTIKADYILGGKPAYDCGRYIYIPNVLNNTLRIERDGGVRYAGRFGGWEYRDINQFMRVLEESHDGSQYEKIAKAIIADYEAREGTTGKRQKENDSWKIS